MTQQGPDYTTEGRYWHYRTNDISQEHVDRLKNVNCEWIFIGNIEEGEIKKGTHRHVAIKFSRSYRFKYVMKQLCTSAEIIPMFNATWHLGCKYQNSTVAQFIEYVFKNDLNNLIYGDVSVLQGVKVDEATRQIVITKTESKEEIQERKNELEKERHYRCSIGDINWYHENDTKYMSTADFNRKLVWAQPDVDKNEFLQEIKNIFLHGPSTTGKSSAIMFLIKNLWYGSLDALYMKNLSSDKWDGYWNLVHKIVHLNEIDNFDEVEVALGGFAGVKDKCDVYPFVVRCNFGNRNLLIRPERFSFCSNYTPNQLFAMPNKYGRMNANIEKMNAAFARRFKVYHIDTFQRKHGIYFDKIKERTFWIKDAPVEPPIIHNLSVLQEGFNIMKQNAIDGKPKTKFQRNLQKLIANEPSLAFEIEELNKLRDDKKKERKPRKVKRVSF